jgi:Gpi18-like mannosyltransferase
MIPTSVKKFLQDRTDWGFPMGLAILTGCLTLVLGFVFSWTISGVYPESFKEIWVRWDSLHYLKIANSWYGNTENTQFLLCYFPLYPFLIATGGIIFHDEFVSGLVVSNVSFAVALVCLHRLVSLDFDRGIARLAVLFCAIFPAAYFFHVIYTESLFFALMLGTLYCARLGRWWYAGILGMLAALTRLNGIVLIPVLMFEYFYQLGFDWRSIRWKLFLTMLPLVAMLIYLIVNWNLTGDPFMFLKIQKIHFCREVSWPFSGFSYDFNSLLTRNVSERFFISGEQILCFIGTLLLIVWSAVKLRPSYTLMMCLLWILTFCYSYWTSVPRFVMMFFPIYIFLGKISEKNILTRYALIISSTMLFTLGTIQFSRGWWAH